MTLTHFLSLTRFNRPIGIWLLLWPTLTALWLAARGMPEGSICFIFVIGTALSRAGGCVLNDLWDRDFDRHVERTKTRVLTSGQVSVRAALWVAIGLFSSAGLLILPLKPLSQSLAVVALGLAGSYPLFKRFFPFPQAYLGLAFGFGIPMAYAAILGNIPPVAWVLLVANIFWTLAYDTEYAMVDKTDDAALGLRSSALTWGQYDRLAVASCYAIYLLIWLGLAYWQNLSLVFLFFWGIATLMAILHIRWIWARDRAQCFRAFQHNHWLGMMIFIAVFTSV